MSKSQGAAVRVTLPLELDEQNISPAFYQDPYPYYRQLRAEAPVAWSQALGAWVLTRYEDVQATLHDPPAWLLIALRRL